MEVAMLENWNEYVPRKYIVRSQYIVYNSQKTHQSSPIRARYGMSFISANLTEVL